jgi:IQ calmodulin-binding motif
MMNPRHRAASVIQAVWRGYFLRSSLRNVDLRYQARYNEVFRDLIRLERDLVLHLTESISNYMVAFRGLCELPEEEDPLSKEEFQSIFSTAIHVHDFHSKLLADLENEWKFFPVIGDAGSIYAKYVGFCSWAWAWV